MKEYFINEVFYSLQGEGVRSGTPNIFLRFGACNLQCKKETEGFDCDTEFSSGEKWKLEQIPLLLQKTHPHCSWVVLTGGEPALQLDPPLIETLKKSGYQLAIETNGTRELPEGLDWICVSPKTEEHSLRQKKADEVKYVRRYGMGIPQTVVEAKHYLISPAFDGDQLDQKNLSWCIELVKTNPPWRLSVQMHKFWQIR